jgi:hypothetical protein
MSLHLNPEEEVSSSSAIQDTWISNFCNLVGHEYFAEVAEDFIEDDFNLTGLSAQVHMYKEALEMILDVEPEDDEEEEEEEEEEDDDDDMLNAGGFRNTSLSTRRHMRMSSDTSVTSDTSPAGPEYNRCLKSMGSSTLGGVRGSCVTAQRSYRSGGQTRPA